MAQPLWVQGFDFIIWGVFWVSCKPDWPQTYYVAQNNLEHCIFLILPPAAGMTGVHHHAWGSSTQETEAGVFQLA